jgi:head-tail adaptor
MNYKDRITFTRQTVAADGSGGVSATGTETLATVWASVKSIGQSRQLSDAMIIHNCAYEITMRYQFTFTPGPGMQIGFNNKVLTIHGVPDVRPRERLIKILAYG